MIDIRGRKNLPVQVDWEGRLPPGLLVRDVEVIPAQVEVSGGQLLIDQLKTVYTEKVGVDELEVSGEIQASIALSPGSLKLAPQQPDKVRIKFNLAPRR